MWQSFRVNALHAIERPVLLVSCRIPQLWTARPPVLLVSGRHGWLPMFEGTRKHAPLHQDHPGSLSMGTTWCRPCMVVPAGYIPLSVLLVVTVCDPSLPPRLLSVCDLSLPPRVVSVCGLPLPSWVVSVCGLPIPSRVVSVCGLPIPSRVVSVCGLPPPSRVVSVCAWSCLAIVGLRTPRLHLSLVSALH